MHQNTKLSETYSIILKSGTFLGIFKPCDFLFAWNFLPMWSPLISCEFATFLESFWLDKFGTTTESN